MPKKNKNKTQKRHGSIFTLLLGNYVLFTLMFVIAFVLVGALFVLRVFTTARSIMPADISRYDELLQRGQYESFPVTDIVGDDSFFTVFDENGTRLYAGAGSGVLFTPRELKLIPDYEAYPSIRIHALEGDNGEKSIEVIYIYYEDDFTEYASYIFDSKLNLIYRSRELGIDNMTQREFAIFTDALYFDYNLHRHVYTDENGKEYTVVIFESISAAEKAMGKVGRVLRDCVIGFIMVYCLLIFGFVLWLKPKIKKPLDLLHKAFNEFKTGTNIKLDYRGPREFVEIVGSFNEMSRRLTLSEQKRTALLNEKSRMLADISHDLKTPITIISGYTKALADGLVPPEEQQSYLNTIDKKAGVLNELINTFYEYSKMEHPEYSLTLTSCDICNTLRDYIADKYSEIELYGGSVVVDIPEVHIFANIDKAVLHRAFDNLVNNALSHNNDPITLYFSLRDDGAFIRIIIADDGVGIPDSLAQSLFEPFIVGEPSRSKHGSGLGLAIARRIAEAHHGSLVLLENGDFPYSAAFELKLPVAGR